MDAHTQQKLADFGQVVLEVLETDIEWDADTTDRIFREALQRGLLRISPKTGLVEPTLTPSMS